MSGGTFCYDQYKIQQIADQIEQYIIINGKKKRQEELASYEDDAWLARYPESAYHTKYSDEVIEKFKQAVYYLNKAQIYAQRVDWLIAGDDGEDSFLERLKEELTKLEK